MGVEIMDNEYIEDDYPCDSCSSSDACDSWEAQFCCTLCHYNFDEPNCDECNPMDI